jgi:hypothetical protein
MFVLWIIFKRKRDATSADIIAYEEKREEQQFGSESKFFLALGSKAKY